MSRIFYVCSYGGSGSTMLTNFLSQFGEAYHVHSRYPPIRLTKLIDAISDNPHNDAKWFGTEELSSEELLRTTVIFIYRNPAKAINSRFLNKMHLQNIQLPSAITLFDVLRSGVDKYGINEFYWNYVKHNETRNYPIFCIKYETLFANWHQFNNALNLPQLSEEEFPENRERKLIKSSEMELYRIYRPLILQMISMPPIYCVANGTCKIPEIKYSAFKTKTITQLPVNRDLRTLTTYSAGKAVTCWKKVC